MENLKNYPVNMEILEIKDKFIRSKDIDTGVNELYKDICAFYNIDRLIIGTKDIEHSICIPILSYEKSKDKEVVHLGAIEDFEDFIKFLSIQTKGNEDEYITLCDNKRHFVGEECIEVYEILKKIGYEVGSMGIPQEYFLTYVKVEAFFSYTIMEIHNKKEHFLDIDMKMLDYIFSIVQLRIEKDILARQLSDETQIKNAIIDNEQTPICMVSKEDHKILYYNDKYKQVLPDVENCEYYYNLVGKDKEFSIEENINTKYLYVDGKYWIRKSADIILSDGIEAYIIYAKHTKDYINQLQGIDLLTSAYTSKGLALYFNNLMLTIKNDENYVLCSLDIDKFKYINDLFGFSNGDILLKKVATKIDKFILESEAFCRVSEDKFAILLKCNIEMAKTRIYQLYKELDKIQTETFFQIKLAYITGIVKVEKKEPFDILLDRANHARKTIKGSHESKIAFFDKQLEDKLKEDLFIEKRISIAVENDEFIPYLQPKFDLYTKKICGAEALVRWITPNGMIYPDRFIPIFERNGFIDKLDFIIYKKIMKHIRECLDNNLKVYPISMNVSRNHIKNKDFTNQIVALINKYNIPIELLELEITEGVFVEDRESLKYFIDNLKKPKIKLSIDDFGTAYSSLQLLKDVDVDILKIDKDFLVNIDSVDVDIREKSKIMIKSIVNLAKDLNYDIICEGIETEEQIKILKAIGCNYGQGYVFAKPMPIDEYKKIFII